MPQASIPNNLALLDPAPLPVTPQTVTVPRRGAHPLARFVARRLVSGVGALFVASIVIFFATTIVPGNPASAVLGRQAPLSAIHALDARMGLNHSEIHQYLHWLSGIVRGNLGNSLVGLAQGESSAPIWQLIRGPLENTFILALVSTILLIPISIVLGMWTALRAGRPLDHLISTVTLVMISMPEFVAGTILLLIFFVGLGLLPAVSLIPAGAFPLSYPSYLVLPVLTLLWTAVGSTVRLVRAGTLEVLDADYVEVARLSGLKERTVIRKYVLRNALAPSVQIFAQSIQYLFGGVIVVETVFSYPGIGRQLVNVVASHDNTQILSTAMIIASVYILINVAADLLVVLLVPRLRTSQR